MASIFSFGNGLAKRPTTGEDTAIIKMEFVLSKIILSKLNNIQLGSRTEPFFRPVIFFFLNLIM